MAKKKIINFPGNRTMPRQDNVTAAMNNARNLAFSGKQNSKPTDKNMTLDVDNSVLNEAIKAYSIDKSVENLNKLISILVGCRILIPAALAPGKNPVPKLLKTNDGKMYLPIYTDKNQIPEEQRKPAVINILYMAANQVALNPVDNIMGIAINPFTDNLLFHKQLLEKISDVEKQKAEAKNTIKLNEERLKENLPKGAELGKDENGNTTIKLTEMQYVQFERTQFEVGYLPVKFFTGGQGFVDKLIEEKGNFIDSMYEDSYQQKRMYPFLPEDFNIMALDISEDTVVISIEMPDKDIAFGNAFRIYLVWNPVTKIGRYFRITKGKEKGSVILEEIAPDKKVTNLGPAPQEGSELTTILELVK